MRQRRRGRVRLRPPLGRQLLAVVRGASPASSHNPPLASVAIRATSPSGSEVQPHGSGVPLTSAVATSVTRSGRAAVTNMGAESLLDTEWVCDYVSSPFGGSCNVREVASVARRRQEEPVLPRGRYRFPFAPRRKVHRARRHLRSQSRPGRDPFRHGARQALAVGRRHSRRTPSRSCSRSSRRPRLAPPRPSSAMPADHPQLQELVKFLAEALVDAPDEVIVEEMEEDGAAVFELTVAEEDLGKVIGKQGRTARALRTILARRPPSCAPALCLKSSSSDTVDVGFVLRAHGIRGVAAHPRRRPILAAAGALWLGDDRYHPARLARQRRLARHPRGRPRPQRRRGAARPPVRRRARATPRRRRRAAGRRPRRLYASSTSRAPCSARSPAASTPAPTRCSRSPHRRRQGVHAAVRRALVTGVDVEARKIICDPPPGPREPRRGVE